MQHNPLSTVKQCGTCKWWETIYFTNLPDDNEGYCNFYSQDMDKSEGQDCPVYEERKA